MTISSLTFLDVLITLGSILVLSCIYRYSASLKHVQYVPGMRVLFSPLTIFGAMIPTRSWNPGLNWSWIWRKTAYMNRTHDIISMVPILFGKPSIYVGSLDVARQLLVNENKLRLEKPADLRKSLLLWGESLSTTNGEDWRRHRRILGPAFSNETYVTVVKETASIYREMVAAEGWMDNTEVVVEEFHRIPSHVAFVALARCGFNVRLPWAEERENEDLSFGKALKTVIRTNLARLAIPIWAYKLPLEGLHKMDQAWKYIGVYMHDLVARRREELRGEVPENLHQRGDLFSRLVAALDENAKIGLKEQEVIGNTFTFMFVGHETSARVLTEALGFLAIHQDEQDKAVNEISSALPAGQDPTFNDLSKLVHLLACFHEALRIYPPSLMMGRDTTSEIPIKVTHPSPQTILLPKGSRVVMDMIALHHDPRVFPDPEKFKPSRWYGKNGVGDEVSMFGLGPRVCIGRKFVESEALTFLSMFLRDWKVDIILSPGETRAQYEDRVMGRARLIGHAFGVEPFPLKVSRRVSV
ncbi:unnamed protein product [Somion occarium]|uniref:Cytochrome P450 n=1 Tax=Somion occarium TaxID=3059160 RepID=A0ABP1DWZ1_9APHY